ncbi:peptidyl-prolyl cis-trans isomerase C [Desulfacinum hydrothermale DSM 13146]|uniref:Peptidyl-prolyl cis-trans isomerase C n=1 Tax=Desulfacinum hydrothermale DSM 13146 TaxID=1121390 RepID=A0A1W1XPS0_9BACT|nr:peptidylprolyl isomerase [Desulfacinum hydrothermale]SMC25852.1 peptidyl-prolyl cis-trans isomerase C [Desulfacinum hydrothermale DSM 13146]
MTHGSKFLMGCFTAVFTLAALTLVPLQAVSAAEAGPAAVVNGTAISRDAFDRQMNGVRQSLVQSGRLLNDVQLRDVKKRVLEGLIDREVLYQAAAAKGFKGDSKAVEDRLADLRGRFDTQEAYTKALKTMNLTEDILRRELTQNSAIEQFIDKELSKGISVSDAEAEAFYKERHELFERPERVHARHILAAVAPDAPESEKKAAREKIAEAQKRLQKGDDFATVASEMSDCPSREKGGDLGFFGRGQMVKPFEKAAFALKPGQTSDVVETQFGYHLIQVMEKKPAETVPFAKVKETIAEHLKKEKVKKVVEDFVSKTKTQAKIERTPVDEL